MTKKFTGIRLEEELLALIDEAAKTDGRSRNSWIERSLEQAVTQSSHNPPPAVDLPKDFSINLRPEDIAGTATRARREDSEHRLTPASGGIPARIPVTLRQAAGRWAWSGGGLNGSGSSKREAMSDASDRLDAVENLRIEWVEE